MAIPAQSPLATLPQRDTILILSSIALVTALAWLYLIHIDEQMTSTMAKSAKMAAMGMSMSTPWTRVDVFFTFAMWAVMMVGMMGPSASPMILLFAAAQEKRAHSKCWSSRASLPAGAFALGYLFVWTAFSAAAALAQWGLHETALISPDMKVLSPRIGGAVLILAGLYQLTPWKNRCLAHCRSPISFLMTHWREGRWSAFEIGIHQGAYCLGCCWALMVILFVVGVMNLAWVAALGALVMLEKVAPHGALMARISGAALIAYGIITIF